MDSLVMLDLGRFVVIVFAIVYVWNMCTKKDESWYSKRLKLLEEQEKHRMRMLEMKHRYQLQQKRNCCSPQGAGFFTVACAFIVGVILGG